MEINHSFKRKGISASHFLLTPTLKFFNLQNLCLEKVRICTMPVERTKRRNGHTKTT